MGEVEEGKGKGSSVPSSPPRGRSVIDRTLIIVRSYVSQRLDTKSISASVSGAKFGVLGSNCMHQWAGIYIKT